MSEKIYACLLKLFPSRFRREYESEALLLFRDRYREERGPMRKLRLCLDLLVDLVAGLPKAYQNSLAAGSSLAPEGHAAPPFQVLESEPLRPGAVLLGTLLSFSAIVCFAWAMGRDIGERLAPVNEPKSPVEMVMQRLNQPMQPEPSAQPATQPEAAAPANSNASAATPSSNGQVQPPAQQDLLQYQQQTSLGRPQQGAMVRASGESGSMSAASRPESAVNASQPGGRVLPASRASSNGVVIATGMRTGESASGVPTAARDAAAAMSQSEPASSISTAQPNVENATHAMVRLMRTHQIVMFGETHGDKQEYEWLCALVKDPAFASQVDDIVVEFGNSLYQKTVDRYIAGGDVPQEQIEKAWRNVIGAVGPVSPVYGWFYKAVREANRQRPSGHQIRLLLGDPYGDWEKIHDAEDLGPFVAHRDAWYAQVVKHEVLAPHHRALLIMGAGHFLRRNGPGLVERAIRDAGVQPYLVVFGTNAVGGYDVLDLRFNKWPTPAIVSLQGNWVGELPANPVLTGGVVAPNAQKMEDVADAMLYVGSRDTLMQVNVPRSDLLDTAYGKEVERRLQIQIGRTMEFTQPLEEPQYHRPLQQVSSNGIHLTPPNPPKSFRDPLPPRPPSQ